MCVLFERRNLSCVALSALLRKQEEFDTAKHKMNKGQKVNPYRFIAEYLYRHHPEKTDVEYQVYIIFAWIVFVFLM